MADVDINSGERLAALQAENKRLRRALAEARGGDNAGGVTQAAEQTAALLRAIGEATPDLIYAKDCDFRLTYANPATCRTIGIPPERVIGLSNHDLARDEEEAAAFDANDRAVIEGGTTRIVDEVYTTPDGKRRTFRSAKTPIRDADGQVIGLAGVGTDITERVEAEALLRQSEAQLRAIFDATPECIKIVAPDGSLMQMNQAGLCMIEAPGAEAVAGASVPDLISEDYRDEWRARHARIVAGESMAWEFDIVGLEGTRRHMETHAVPLPLPDGQNAQLAVTRDVTERKTSDEALRESEARFRELADQINQFAWTADATGWIYWYNKRWYDYTGTTFEQMQGWGWRDVHHPDHVERVVARFAAAIEKGELWEDTFPLRAEDGTYRWFLSRARPIRDEAGNIVRWLGTNTDVEDLRLAEAALREESRVLETLNRTGAAIAAELDLERLVQMVTDAGVALTGAQFGAFFYNVLKEDGERFMLYTLSGAERADFEHFGMPRPTALFHPTFAGEGTIRSDDILADPRYGQNDPHGGMPHGHLPVRSYLAVSVIGRSGEVIGALLFGHGEPGRFTERHERLITGIAGQAAIGIDNARLYQSAQQELAERMRAEERLRELNETLEQRVGKEVARRTEAEEALRQAQKMETLGQLTGGVAHDFNNLLQIVTGNLDILRRNLPEDAARLRRSAENAMRGAERAAVLTQRLLAFARRSPLEPKPISLNKLVGGMSELLHRTLGETIEVETVLAPNLWNAEADPNQLENAVLNLAINARDAMPEGGKLTLETSNTLLDHAYAAQNTGVTPGQYVVLCVSDTGIGMDTDTLEKVFEPFFTTKDVGRGTGLGLSMVYGFIKQSGGHVKIYSEPGHGTTVKLYLPRMAGSLQEEREADQPLVPEGTREETILVCEDDDDVRAYSVEVLRELGYRVLEAHDGPSALRLLERQEGRVDLLFTDVVLPSGMMGNDLAGQARAVRPELKVLFTTGYARNAIVHHGRLDPGVELITKPFTYADLAGRIRDLLDRG